MNLSSTTLKKNKPVVNQTNKHHMRTGENFQEVGFQLKIIKDQNFV